ncbi:MAG: hypothetical protein WD967_00830 [Candidatus Levyibacteriota bacterium]
MLRKLLTIFILVLAYFILYRIYMARVSAFGCFDDCFNIAAGYFINEGKTLYSDIFFNHQMLMPHISAYIQHLNPINVYELVLRHRQFVLLFGFLFNLLLFLRFGSPMIPFVITYEFTKFYLFGDRFLAEGLVVYPLVYLSSLAFHKVLKKRIFPIDYFLASVFAWFVIFMREPFVLLAVFLLLFVYYGKFQKLKVLSFAIFIVLSSTTLLLAPLNEYFQNVVVMNSIIFKGDLQLLSLLKSFLYPFQVVLSNEKNPFMLILIPISLAFILYAFNLVKDRKYALFIAMFVILGLANFRNTEPGKIFHESFHILPWYGLIVAFTFLLIFNFAKKYFAAALVILTSLFLLYIPRSFLVEKINSHEEFITNYGHILETGNVFSILKEEGDTYFADGFDELTHWQVDLPSPYKYSWYTSFMPRFETYSTARLEMFRDSPPVFYYGSCPEDKNAERLIPDEYKNQYRNITREEKPTCLYVRGDKTIPEEKIRMLKQDFNLDLKN